jgi:DNA-binding cell septation regulator SpoVG
MMPTIPKDFKSPKEMGFPRTRKETLAIPSILLHIISTIIWTLLTSNSSEEAITTRYGQLINKILSLATIISKSEHKFKTILSTVWEKGFQIHSESRMVSGRCGIKIMLLSLTKAQDSKLMDIIHIISTETSKISFTSHISEVQAEWM